MFLYPKNIFILFFSFFLRSAKTYSNENLYNFENIHLCFRLPHQKNNFCVLIIQHWILASSPFDQFDENYFNNVKKYSKIPFEKMIRKEAWIAAQLSFKKIQKVTNPHTQFTLKLT